MREYVEQWRGQITLACREYGVPPALAAAVCDQESGGRQFNEDGTVVTSSVGARGLMQLMPGTAADLGVDPDDPEQNIKGGIRYLSQNYNRFGEWLLAAAAHNAGPNAVAEYDGVPPYAETQRYVRAIQVLLLRYLDWDWDLIWGADKTVAPGSGSYQEAAANLLGILADRDRQRAAAETLVQQAALELAPR